ncbi:restriction system protein [Fontibacillus solani]|uniref:Restriction system protein n=1 Tax=Fontibacillus solani TaxID=1572857 RepID=A0A7W3SXT3_9BACL|nr:restriction endonuclease [Fontibacillus solani]MBA9088224.1 restriction system protein [Fontibacillus solani]
MSRKYTYSVIINNDYLRVNKEIKGITRSEVHFKAEEQLRKWAEKEKKAREREFIADLKQEAEFDTKSAIHSIEEYKNILKETLRVNDKLNWNSLKDKKIFSEKEPEIQAFYTSLGVPKEKKLLEAMIKSLKEKRLVKETTAQNVFHDELKEYQQRKQEYLEKQNEHNMSIDQFKHDFEQGHGMEIEKYIYMVLEKSQYPEGFEQDYELQFDPISGTVIVNYNLPGMEFVPRIIQYKYVASRKEIDIIKMKDKEFNAYYEDVLYQICLRTIHEVFESVYIDDVMNVVFNGWVTGIDKKTGNDFHSCILSCHVSKEEFLTYNLERVEPKECFKNMKGLVAGPLAHLAPVRPILELRTDDKRFVESHSVLEYLDSSTNLAEMDWGEFEHLVRELFSSVFSSEQGEVKVTRASRDGGVDAIAFDPDPIRGGKFVIQAKRYNNVVPVSAVRDLYGTILSEGATKGILVTTSYFGPDSRDFAKNKPITLIDGANLVYMFQEYGHQVYINLNN